MGYFMRNGPTLEEIRNGCYEALKISETNSYLPEIKNGEHPKVGCVILDRSGKIIAKSYTRERGKLHAEVIAIQKMKENKEQGHTLITTLEPCSFRNPKTHGDELPCAKKIVRAGIRQVVIGSLDPGIGVKGRGVYILSRRKVYCTMFPHDIYLEVLKSNVDYIKKQENKILSGRQRKLVPVEREFDLSWHPKINKFLISKFFNRMEYYYKEYLTSSYSSFDDYLIGQKGSKIIRVLGKRMRQLISDYLAIPPDENEDYHIIKGISRWYLGLKWF
jgi:diaminohydroxyphosphoribosylaminopyrimidine deaminase/5-amino-6-(5-phosphoribosylamino)uracil reductase